MTKKTIALIMSLALMLAVGFVLPYGGGKAALAAPNEDEQTFSLDKKRQEAGKAPGSTVTLKTCDGGSISLKADEKRIFELHNETRKKRGLWSLCVDPTLTKAARYHSEEMIDEGYFDHDSHSGETAEARLKGLGYDWRAFGENIARGSGSMSKPEDRFEAWMHSEGHRKNILDGNFGEVGVGMATGEYEGTAGTAIYTVDFGTRRR